MKLLLSASMMAAIAILSGCSLFQTEQALTKNQVVEVERIPEPNEVQQAEEIDEVVAWSHKEIRNLQRLDAFVENVSNHIQDKVRVEASSKEGERIEKILTYDGESIRVAEKGAERIYDRIYAADRFDEHYHFTFLEYWVGSNDPEGKKELIAQIQPGLMEAVPDTSKPAPAAFTQQEFYAFEYLRADWTKEQMEELGLAKEVNEGAGETYYSNESIRYTFFDFYNAETTAVVDVFGDYPGPRGISVGAAFQDVMALLPQEKNWRSSAAGVFYGNYDFDVEQADLALSGHVSSYDDGKKEITLITEGGFPFLRIFFEGDIVTHYTFFLIAAY